MDLWLKAGNWNKIEVLEAEETRVGQGDNIRG
jgi:hypothetical protein